MLNIFLKHDVKTLSSSAKLSSLKLIFGKKCSIFDKAIEFNASIFKANGRTLSVIFPKISV